MTRVLTTAFPSPPLRSAKRGIGNLQIGVRALIAALLDNQSECAVSLSIDDSSNKTNVGTS